jgi:hypothetical protein
MLNRARIRASLSKLGSFTTTYYRFARNLFMRRCTFFFSALVLTVFVALPLAARAQFHEPTKEELSMTTDPKAPGAAAVYLNYEERADDQLHYHSVYARIKVLTEKGKDLATVNLPYVRGEQKIAGIQARTIHPDGTVVPLVGKPEDLLAVKTKDKTIGQRVFSLPSVEVGSILEYEYDVRYDDDVVSSPYWEIQKKYFVHKAHYFFAPAKDIEDISDAHGNMAHTLLYWHQLPQGDKVVEDAMGRFSIDLEDIPGAPDEEYMPPMDAFLFQVLFYYTSAHDAAGFWDAEAKRWSKDVDHFAEPSKAIQAAVAGIVAPGDSDVQKAQKLYTAVQALDNTDFSRARGKAELKAMGLKVAKRAEDTWAQKSGSKQDITLLYLAMLRAAGIQAFDMKVVDRNRSLFQPSYLDFDQLDDDVILTNLGGKDVVLDPGEKMCPFGVTSWVHQGAGGVRQITNGRAGSMTPLMPYTANTITRLGDVTIDASGGVTGSFRVVMTGQPALHWRQMMLENDENEVKKEFDSDLEELVPEGVSAHLDHFLGMDDENTNLMAMVKVEGTLGAQAGKRVLLPGFFFESRARQPFVQQAERKAPVDMHYSSRVVDQITYHLPAGMSVEGAPKDDHILWTGNADLITKTAQEPGKITVARALVQGFIGLNADQYKDLRGFYQKVAASDQQQLVLTQAAVAKN